MRSKKINLILHDGTPYGIKTAELSNWNGKVVIASRSAIKKLKELDEADMPAVYFLFGEDNTIYVGETDSLSARLASHALQKEFWNEMIAVVSPELSKTEVKYLEHVFIEKLREDGQVTLENGNQPKSPTIKKEIQDVLADFVDNVSDILIALGFEFIGASQEVEAAAKKGVTVYCKGPDADARGVWSSNGLLVKKGSTVRKSETKTIPANAASRRETMVKAGYLVQGNLPDSYMLTIDMLFESPSLAAAFVLSRSANGLAEWKNEDGKTIKELEQE